MKYICSKCGYETLKWEGKCSSCDEWGCLEELQDINESKNSLAGLAKIVSIEDLDKSFSLSKGAVTRLSSGYDELDRVLGGGFVGGQVVLIAGEPGIGKSTLLLQSAISLSKKKKVVYVSVEESLSQIHNRYKRLCKGKAGSLDLVFSEEVVTEKIINMLEKQKPDLCIIDSIQALESSSVSGIVGGVSQIRANGYLITKAAKRLGIPVVIVGQITKDGFVAGPKVLEHIVDSVLHLQGDEFNIFRILRCIKNRYGATSEIGVFEMTSGGMVEVSDPSQIFIQQDRDTIGSALTAVLKGTRVVFVEVQALVTDVATDNIPLKRVANGIKKPRLDMLCAVLSRRGGLFLGNKDVFLNVVGGLKVDDPTIDLAICAAIKSAVKEKEIGNKSIYVGEVGLTGEVRGCMGWDLIVKEAKRLGYEFIYASKYLKSSSKKPLVKQVPSLKGL